MSLVYPDIDPIIFSFSLGNFDFALRWYALSYIAGILIAWKIMQSLANKSLLWPAQGPPLRAPAVDDLMTYLILYMLYY